MIALAIIGAATVINLCVNGTGQMQLAHQIADGTHKVVWSVNEFGTKEVRIVEVKNAD